MTDIKVTIKSDDILHQITDIDLIDAFRSRFKRCLNPEFLDELENMRDGICDNLIYQNEQD